MGDAQCSLCLSCGAPFLPNGEDAVLDGNVGTSCILFLNARMKTDPGTLRKYNTPSFTSKREAAHVIHEGHHEAALRHMIFHHSGDRTLVLPIRTDNAPIHGLNMAMPYYQKSSKSEGPRLAAWIRPAARDRMNLTGLFNTVSDIFNDRGINMNLPPTNLGVKYDTCSRCNKIMTQKANFGFWLGCSERGINNIVREALVRRLNEHPITAVWAVTHRVKLPQAHGRWSRKNRGDHSADQYHLPGGTDEDALSPHVAYYLHQCLPWQGTPGDEPFVRVGFENNARMARMVYLELCWVVLEITCLMTQLREGRMHGTLKLSWGVKENRGALEFYISYFVFRLFQYRHLEAFQDADIDFVQWHQKYFCEASGNALLFPGARVMIHERVMVNTEQPARRLVSSVGARLIELHNTMLPLADFVAGVGVIPRGISEYFVGVDVLRDLVAMSALEVVVDNVDGTLDKFGINAIMGRALQLSANEVGKINEQMKDFVRSWQYKEIDNVRMATKGITTDHAYVMYAMCKLQHAPDVIPYDKMVLRDLLRSPVCSPWRSIMALQAIGALDTERA